jgi:hypothetical protein
MATLCQEINHCSLQERIKSAINRACEALLRYQIHL